MLEDVLLIKDKHREAAAEIVKIILERKNPKFIVAISGESGSGKSELTHVVAKEMRKHSIFAKPVHIDNFYNTLPLERTEWRIRNGIEKVVGLNEYKWDEIDRVVDDFKNSNKSSMPCVDLVTEQVDTLTTDFDGIDMLIIDGLYAINTDNVDLAVYIELTYHEKEENYFENLYNVSRIFDDNSFMREKIIPLEDTYNVTTGMTLNQAKKI